MSPPNGNYLMYTKGTVPTQKKQISHDQVHNLEKNHALSYNFEIWSILNQIQNYTLD